MEINKLLDELILLLDSNEDIKRISRIKKKISNKTLSLIKEYRLNPSVENKKELYNDPLFVEYLNSESNINYLIMEINNRFKRGKSCENNKW